MPWPYQAQWAFEDGTVADLSETDAGSPEQGAVVHFSELARSGHTPFIGAYCYRIQLNGNAETCFIDDTSVSLATTDDGYFAMACYLSDDFALSGNDEANSINLINVNDGGVALSEVRLQNDSGVLRFVVTHEGGGTDDVIGTTYTVPLGKWFWIELLVRVNTTSGALSTLWVTQEGESTATQVATTAGVTGIAGAPAPDSARVGVSINAGTGHTGTILIDSYIYSDPNGANGSGRIPMQDNRWTTSTHIHMPQHVFVGPGWVDGLTMIAGATDLNQEVILYDTDQAQNDDDRILAHLHNTAGNETVDVSAPRIFCQNGAYIELIEAGVVISSSNGTTPRAIVQMSPTYFGSRSQIVQFGLRR